ncbi:uncharacterized protein [Rutidosis leptorrhynchoides]|uniref:uncharacterized protein n=1 Tax=Rutidosis leptorrhynchoides TaxID=125765 RepID=UPI003A994DB6
MIVVVVVGYGYVWWKGWKLPDMMFATRRSLSDATNAVSKQLDNVFTSVAATKRYLSSRIDRVNTSLDEVAELTASIQDEVSGVHDKSKLMSLDIKSVHDAVYSMESKLNRIELMQDDTYIGVSKLLRTAASLENQATAERIQGSSSSSRPALEMPQRAMSLPPVQLDELQSSPPVSPRARRPLETTFSSASGLMILHEDLDVAEAKSTPRPSNGLNVTEDGSSSAHVFGRTLSSLSSVFTRARTANKQ